MGMIGAPVFLWIKKLLTVINRSVNIKYMLPEQQKAVYEAIKLDPRIRLTELQHDLDISYNSIRYAVAQLVEKEYLEEGKVFIIK